MKARHLRRLIGGCLLALSLVASTQTAAQAFKREGRPPVTVFEPDTAPVGTVVTLHGGGWFSAADYGGTADGMMRRWIEMFTAGGVRVVNVDYDSGAASLQGTIRSLRWVDRRWPSSGACVLGFSAGGHLALAADLEGAEPSCAVSVAGPMNLIDSTPELESLARAFFGDRVRELSPELHPGRVDAPSLLVGAVCDETVPFAKQVRAARTLGARFFAVQAGRGGEDLHCPTNRRSYKRAMARQLRFVTRHLTASTDASRQAGRPYPSGR